MHDAQLDDDPELLNAAGAVALLAAENAELDAGWNERAAGARDARARASSEPATQSAASSSSNLHDGVQQHLIAIRIELELAARVGARRPRDPRPAHEIGDTSRTALEELREVAHGLYPPLLSRLGARRGAGAHPRRDSGAAIAIEAAGIGRHSPEIESAVYYCCLEAIQNASKHGGPAVHISVTLRQDGDELTFDVERRRPRLRPAEGQRHRPPEHARPPRRARRPPVDPHRARQGHDDRGDRPVPATTATPPEALTQSPL